MCECVACNILSKSKLQPEERKREIEGKKGGERQRERERNKERNRETDKLRKRAVIVASYSISNTASATQRSSN